MQQPVPNTNVRIYTVAIPGKTSEYKKIKMTGATNLGLEFDGLVWAV